MEKKKIRQQPTKQRTRVKSHTLKPADKILNRILWDPSFDKKHLLIGYQDRFIGIQEIDLEGFTESEIPMHRIYYFKYLGKTIWDRNARLDLITGKDISQLVII